jgi:hypothetical protein
MPTDVVDHHFTFSRRWAVHAMTGLMVGACIASLDFLYLFPTVSVTTPGAIGFGLYFSSVAVYCGEWMLLALLLCAVQSAIAPAELCGVRLAIALPVGVLVSVIAWHAVSMLVLRDVFGMPLFREQVGQPGNWIGGMLYHAWLMLFFGGLIAAVRVSERRRTRMLSALRSAELARANSQQRLVQARLASLEARVDPDHLYTTLSRVERLYEEQPPAADLLLDELIVSLRNGLNEARITGAKEVI